MPKAILFPLLSEHIEIHQGRVGDCYFLAAMDCVLNDMPEGRQHIASLFTARDDGSVVLRLPHSSLSGNLQVDNLKKKYGYTFDEDTKEHVIRIAHQDVKRIDGDQNGVTSNALSLKILEHIISYYYKGDWAMQGLLESVLAHDISDRNDRNHSSTEFIAKLLGFDATDYALDKIDAVIEQKMSQPNAPLYISMAWGLLDGYGRIHGRHALKVKSIRQSETDSSEYIFELINPHDNTKTVEFPLSVIRNRNPRFSFFSLRSPSAKKQKSLYALLAECINDKRFIELIIKLAIEERSQVTGHRQQAIDDIHHAIMRYYITGKVSALKPSKLLSVICQKFKETLNLNFYMEAINSRGSKQQAFLIDLAIEQLGGIGVLFFQQLLRYQQTGEVASVSRLTGFRQLIEDGLVDINQCIERFPLEYKITHYVRHDHQALLNAIDKGAIPANWRNERGWGLAHFVASYHQSSLVAKLRIRNIDFNIRTKRTGRTPLFLAYDKATFDAMIAAGASVNVTDNKNENLLSYLRRSNPVLFRDVLSRAYQQHEWAHFIDTCKGFKSAWSDVRTAGITIKMNALTALINDKAELPLFADRLTEKLREILTVLATPRNCLFYKAAFGYTASMKNFKKAYDAGDLPPAIRHAVRALFHLEVNEPLDLAIIEDALLTEEQKHVGLSYSSVV